MKAVPHKEGFAVGCTVYELIDTPYRKSWDHWRRIVVHTVVFPEPVSPISLSKAVSGSTRIVSLCHVRDKRLVRHVDNVIYP